MVRGDGDRDGRLDPCELFDGDRVRERVGARAAVLLGDRHPHQPEVCEPVDEVIREPLLAIELLCDGRDLLGCKRTDRLPDELVLVAEVEVQRESACASSTISRTP